MRLPQTLSESLPNVRVDLCTSAESLARQLSLSSYETIALSPLLIQDYRLVKQTKPLQFLAPLLVTASAEQRPLAQAALETQAFDLIVKPIVPAEAAHTVRLALWQNRLLRLLTAQEQAVSRVHEHMTTFPHARPVEEQFKEKMSAYERTFTASRSSLCRLLNVEDEEALFDMAAAVEGITRQRALARLHALSTN